MLEDVTDQEVPTSVQIVDGLYRYSEVASKVAIVTPIGDLRPLLSYRVEVLGPGKISGSGSSRFVTGPARSDALPAGPGQSSVSISCWDPDPNMLGDCQDQSIYPMHQFVLSAAAIPSVVGYRIYRNGSPVAFAHALPARIDVLPVDTIDLECFVVHAIALNSSEAPGTQVCVDTRAARCSAERTADGGNEDSNGMLPDLALDAETPSFVDASSGCHCCFAPVKRSDQPMVVLGMLSILAMFCRRPTKQLL